MCTTERRRISGMTVVDSCKVKNGKLLLLLLYSIKTRLECSAISVAAVAATTPPPSHRETSDQRRRRRRWLMILYWQRADSLADREEKAQENRLYLRPDLVVVLFPLHTLSSPLYLVDCWSIHYFIHQPGDGIGDQRPAER